MSTIDSCWKRAASDTVLVSQGQSHKSRGLQAFYKDLINHSNRQHTGLNIYAFTRETDDSVVKLCFFFPKKNKDFFLWTLVKKKEVRL